MCQILSGEDTGCIAEAAESTKTRKKREKIFKNSGQPNVRLRHSEDRSGMAGSKDHLAVYVGNPHNVATRVGLLEVDVVHPKGVLLVNKVIGGNERQPESPAVTPNHEEPVNSAIVDDFARHGLPPAPWRILLVDHSDMVRAALPGGSVNLRVDLAAVLGPLEHDSISWYLSVSARVESQHDSNRKQTK